MFAARMGVIWNWRKSVKSSFRRDTMSSGNSSSFSMPQNQEKKQIPSYEVHFTNKNHPFMWLVCKTRAQKFYCLTQRHCWRPRVSCLWGHREDHIKTSNRLSPLDRLEIFWNDWGDRDDPDDHMETRLNEFYTGGSDRLSKFGRPSEVDLRYTFS